MLSEQEPRTQADRKAAPWRFKQLLLALGIGIILQMLFLPCLCQEGTAKVQVAFIFDGLYLGRVLWAYWRKETGRGWIFYAALMYSSSAWISASLWIHDMIVH